MGKLCRLSFSLAFILGLLFIFQPGLAGQTEKPPVIDPDQVSFTDPHNASPLYTGCGGRLTPVVNADFEQRVVELVNTARADYGLPPLKLESSLTAAARYHAADLGTDNYFAHDTYDRVDGNLVYVCSAWERIATYYSSARGENAAAGYPTPEAVMDGWMSSSGHRTNILSTGNWEIGVGYYAGSGDYYQYWVQDFGLQSGIYPLIIDLDAGSTATRSVSLYIYGNWQEMRLRNEDGAWTNWQPFTASSNWTLSAGLGQHQVTAELRNGNQTATSSDTIYLTADNNPPIFGNLPDQIYFTYSIPDQELYPGFAELEPLNMGNDEILQWQASQEGNFFFLDRQSGATPQSIRVTLTNFNPTKPQVYSGKLTLAVSDPPGVAGSPHEITLTLKVAEASLNQVFLPGVIRK